MMSLHDQSNAPRRTTTGFMAVALVVCSSITSGCAHFAENLSALCTTTPPVYDEEFLPPADFGYYQAHWDRWPCAELTIDRGHRPDEQAKKKTSDTGSTPGDTTGAENEMNNEGVPGRKDDPDALPDNLFEPDRNSPLPNKTPDETPPPDTTPDEPGLTPPDPNAPDAMPPDTVPPDAPTDAIPEVKPPSDATPIPDDLFEKKPAGTPPGHGSLGTELPIDAPDGDLVSDGPETNRKKVAVEKKPNAAPTGPALIPTTPRIESARRPSAIRRTSAIEPLPRVQRDVFAEDESEGPNLQAPAMNRSSAVPPKSEASSWTRSVKGSSARKAMAAPTKWPGDDDVQQPGTARNAKSGRGAVATDSR
jgi:hypothetical protein